MSDNVTRFPPKEPHSLEIKITLRHYLSSPWRFEFDLPEMAMDRQSQDDIIEAFTKALRKACNDA